MLKKSSKSTGNVLESQACSDLVLLDQLATCGLFPLSFPYQLLAISIIFVTIRIRCYNSELWFRNICMDIWNRVSRPHNRWLHYPYFPRMPPYGRQHSSALSVIFYSCILWMRTLKWQFSLEDLNCWWKLLVCLIFMVPFVRKKTGKESTFTP